MEPGYGMILDWRDEATPHPVTAVSISTIQDVEGTWEFSEIPGEFSGHLLLLPVSVLLSLSVCLSVSLSLSLSLSPSCLPPLIFGMVRSILSALFSPLSSLLLYFLCVSPLLLF